MLYSRSHCVPSHTPGLKYSFSQERTSSPCPLLFLLTLDTEESSRLIFYAREFEFERLGRRLAVCRCENPVIKIARPRRMIAGPVDSPEFTTVDVEAISPKRAQLHRGGEYKRDGRSTQATQATQAAGGERLLTSQ